MLQLMAGAWVAQAISVAAGLRIADHLRDGPKPCDALARVTETNPDALYRVLRALAAVQVFAELEDRRFCLTPLAESLLGGEEGSLRDYAIMLGAEEMWRPVGDMLACVRTGQPAFERIFGMKQFAYFARNAEAGRRFNEGMVSRSREENRAIIEGYDFSQFGSVVDVGGGQGSLLSAILAASPATRGVLFDMPHVVAAARDEMTAYAGRCAFREGDFFKAVPAGGDAYILKKVIHDWDDERAMAILRRCREAMPPSARLLLIEPVIAPGNAPSFNKSLDLLMLVITSGGKERTEAEHRALLGSAGFAPVRLIPTNCPLSIIEAMPG
jgi:hypothetical protein